MEIHIQIADKISSSLSFSLRRQYLDVPIEQAKYIQPIQLGLASLHIDEIHFLRLEQVGAPNIDSLNDPFTALQTVLSGCHIPKQHPILVFIVYSDGNKNHIYWGVKLSSKKHSTRDFVENIGNSLEGNWPGVRLRPCNIRNPDFEKHVLKPLSTDLHYASALTGIPSLKTGDHPGYPQSLDRLLHGSRGLPFMYMVLAKPIDQQDVVNIIYQCQNLIGQVHAISKLMHNETVTEGMSVTKGHTSTVVKQETRSFSSVYKLLNPIVASFPPAVLLSMLEGTSFTSSTSLSDSESIGSTSSVAEALGREYVNAHAQAAEEHLRHYVARYEQARVSGCWNVGVYLLSKRPDIVQRTCTQLRSLLSGPNSSFEPIRIHDLEYVWKPHVQNALSAFEQPILRLVDPLSKKSDGGPRVLEHPLGHAFNNLTTPLNSEELALLVNLPRREVSGIKVVPTADFSLNPPKIPEVEGRKQGISLGTILEGGKNPASNPLTYDIPLSSLAKHTLLTGINGSGKSTTCRQLLRHLYLDHGIPFLVIEPTKDEYATWAIEFNQKLKAQGEAVPIAIYMPGSKSWRGQSSLDELHLNPFDFVHLHKVTPRVLAHIDQLKAILNATFPMQESLPYLLEELIFDVYSTPQQGGEDSWLTWSGNPTTMPVAKPTLNDLTRERVERIVSSKGYDKWVTSNLIAALTTRFESLRRGWKSELFGATESTPWEMLFDRPVVINLQHMGDKADRALAMALLMLFLYEYRQIKFELAANAAKQGQELIHLTVIEEAHRILRPSMQERIDLATPQAKAAEMFADVLSEIRAYGEGMLIIDQSPCRLIPDAIKNTNLKIAHRLVAQDDCEAMAHAMGLNPNQTAVVNRLRPGQAIVFGDLDDLAAWIKVESVRE